MNDFVEKALDRLVYYANYHGDDAEDFSPEQDGQTIQYELSKNYWKDIKTAPQGIPVLTYEFDEEIGDTAEVATLTFDGIWDCKGYKRGDYKPTYWKNIEVPK